jgi:hypothetical protein
MVAPLPIYGTPSNGDPNVRLWPEPLTEAQQYAQQAQRVLSSGVYAGEPISSTDRLGFQWNYDTAMAYATADQEVDVAQGWYPSNSVGPIATANPTFNGGNWSPVDQFGAVAEISKALVQGAVQFANGVAEAQRAATDALGKWIVNGSGSGVSGGSAASQAAGGAGVNPQIGTSVDVSYQQAALATQVGEILSIITGESIPLTGPRWGFQSLPDAFEYIWGNELPGSTLVAADALSIAGQAGATALQQLIRFEFAPAFLFGIRGDATPGDQEHWPSFIGLDPGLQELGQSDAEFLATQFPLKPWQSALNGSFMAGYTQVLPSGASIDVYYSPIGVSTRPGELTWAYLPSSGLPLRSGQTDYMLVLSMLPIQFPT